jgi:hypothetical protein
MSGNFKGAQAVIREVHPAALYVHFSAYLLTGAYTRRGFKLLPKFRKMILNMFLYSKIGIYIIF